MTQSQLSDFTCPFGRVAVVPVTVSEAANRSKLNFGDQVSATLVAFNVVVGNSNAARPPLGVPVLFEGDTIYLEPAVASSLQTSTLPPTITGQVLPEFKLVDVARIQVYRRGSR